jgi:CRP-like cAMP-binding protein
MSGPLNLEQIIRFLLETPMFGDLDTVQLSQIVHVMQVQRVREDHYLFHEDEPGDAWYVLFEGSVDVVKSNKEGGERKLATITPRGCFGEMSILDGSSRSASVRAVMPSTVFRFPRAEFRELLEQDNLAAYKLVHQMALVLVARQRRTTQRLVQMLRVHPDAEVQEGLTPLVEESSPSE